MGLTFGELSETPIGPISFYAGDSGLQCVEFTTLHNLKIKSRLTEDIPSLAGLETINVLLSELNEYLFGINMIFSVKIDWQIIEGFQRQVLLETAKISYGQVRTYGDIAKKLGKPKSARAVGRALGSNPMPIVIPCHRVIGADGRLTGYKGGIQAKVFLLGLEGYNITEDRLDNF